MLKLVIFDHDGLMVNSEEIIYLAIKNIFLKYNHNFTWEYYCRRIGLPIEEALRIYYRDFPISISFKEFISKRHEMVNNLLETNLKAMPGLYSFLTYLKKKNIKMAIATSGKRDYIVSNLKKLSLANYFKTIICIDDVVRGKPHSDLILKTLEKTGVKNTQAIILEDSPNGIKAAKRAKIFSIAVPTKGIDLNLYKDADLMCKDLSSVEKILRFINLSD